jgi:hypothetical protein
MTHGIEPAATRAPLRRDALAVLALAALQAGCAIGGYEIVARQQSAALAPGEALRVEVLCPEGKHVIGGGGDAQWTPPGSAVNYTLKSSGVAGLTPAEQAPRTATGWAAVFTNATELTHPQVVTFTVEAICARTR